MAKPYLYERQSEYWTSRQIEEFFLDAGFELIRAGGLGVGPRQLIDII